jgi:DHA1 family bicyclomycin/chloramphenicol resistance-like MFS transporter
MTPFVRNAIVLGLLSAVGPFAIDMYLPALPKIAIDLHASAAGTQATLIGFFVSFGFGQLAYGPWSDIVGRKAPLYVGLTLFTFGGIGCGLAPSIGWLIAFRVLQGIGAAAGAVLPRAIVRDLHNGAEATRLMALIMLVFSISPILAPLAGSALIITLGWRSVFAAITIVALAGLTVMATALPETRPRNERVEASLTRVFQGVAVLLKDARFMGLTLTGGLGMGSFFVFIANSPFVYIDHFGLDPTQYGLAFSINAVGFIGSAMLAAPFGSRLGVNNTIVAAASAYACFASLLFCFVVVGAGSLPTLIGLLFCTFACLGLVIPATAMLALQDYGEIAGMASALGGTLQMAIAAVAMPIAGVMFDGSARPMVALIALCAIGVVATALITLLKNRYAPIGQPWLKTSPDDT